MTLVQVCRAISVAAAFSTAGCGGLATSPAPSGGAGVAPAQVHGLGPSSRERRLKAWIISSGILKHRSSPARHTPNYPTSSKLLFVSDVGSVSVGIYKLAEFSSNPAPIATITDGLMEPYGVAGNAKTGEIYVADLSAGVLEYKKGQTTSSATITNGISEPSAVTVNSAGELWVSNLGSKDVTVYPNGKFSPSEAIGGLECPVGSAFDAKGTFYVADACAAQVYEVSKGSTSAKSLHLTGLEKPWAVAVDVSANLWVTDAKSAQVNVYAPGSKKPGRTIKGLGALLADAADPSEQMFVTGGNAVYEFARGSFSPAASLTNGLVEPSGVYAE